MVLGTILYEGIDLTYHALKLGYYGASSVYSYFWGVEKEMTQDEMQEMIKDLQSKIEKLEMEQKVMEKQEVTKGFTSEEIQKLKRALSSRSV
tara:strand:- start:343 stop:618 length:276 start_codon:yes stop_codon:yes gene_type:complete